MANILLIEDDDINIELYRVYLENSGHDVTVCTDGMSGLETMLQLIPDLVILDYMLPGLNGNQVYQEMKKIISTKNIPVILVTAFTLTAEYCDKFPELPRDCFLFKPIKFTTLTKKINELLTSQTEK